MTDSDLETRDIHRLRHAPGWVGALIVAAILLVEFAVLWWASGELAARPMRYDQGTLRAVIVGTLFVGAGLQFVVLAMPPLVEVTGRRILRRRGLGLDDPETMPPLVEVTGRRILRRRGLGLDDPETMPLAAVEEVREEGWQMTVIGGGRRLSFPCPPPFAPRVRRAIARGRGGRMRSD